MKQLIEVDGKNGHIFHYMKPINKDYRSELVLEHPGSVNFLHQGYVDSVEIYFHLQGDEYKLHRLSAYAIKQLYKTIIEIESKKEYKPIED